MVASWHEESEGLIKENGGLYQGAKVSLIVARESGITALTLGTGQVLRASGTAAAYKPDGDDGGEGASAGAGDSGSLHDGPECREHDQCL